MTVNTALNNIEERQLGYVRMIAYAEGGDAEERTLDTYSTRELLDCWSRECSAYYIIGEYAYILYKA